MAWTKTGATVAALVLLTAGIYTKLNATEFRVTVKERQGRVGTANR